MRLSHWLPGLLIACAAPEPSIAPGATLPEDSDGDVTGLADTDGGAVAPLSCDATLAWLQPDGNARQVPVGARISAGFSEPLPEQANAWALYVEGVTGSVDVSPDRRVVTFVPDGPLLHDTTYEIVTRVCDTEITRAFRTIRPPVSLDGLDGASWLVNTADATWLAPSSSSVFVPALALPDFLLGTVQQDDGLHLIARPAISYGRLAPMPCGPTLDFGALVVSPNPLFHTSADTLDFTWFGEALSIGGVRASGSFADDGHTLTDLSLEATFDTRELEDLTGLSGLCGVAAQLGEPCVPCADGELSCMQVVVTYDMADGVGIDAHLAAPDPLGLCELL